MSARAASVGAVGIAVDIAVAEVDAREVALRAGPLAAALPAAGTSEGRQLRRWLVQLLVAERVVALEADRLGVTADTAPSLRDVLPDAVTSLEIGSVAASVLADPLARATFAHVTAAVEIPDDEVTGYQARNPTRFAGAPADVREAIRELLIGAARRRTFRRWLDARTDALTTLEPGYEHPGDPRQPDNTHRH